MTNPNTAHDLSDLPAYTAVALERIIQNVDARAASLGPVAGDAALKRTAVLELRRRETVELDKLERGE